MAIVIRAKINTLKIEGNKSAVILSKLREDKGHLIGAVLLGNNIVNITAFTIDATLAIHYFGEQG